MYYKVHTVYFIYTVHRLLIAGYQILYDFYSSSLKMAEVIFQHDILYSMTSEYFRSTACVFVCVQASDEHMKKHYLDLKDKPFYEGLCQYMSSGPVLAMVTTRMHTCTRAHKHAHGSL